MAARGDQLRLMVLDIDRFKLVNDRYGHDTGDEVLMIVATLLSDYASSSIGVARLGGEEFAIVGKAADLPPSLAEVMLARIRQAEMPHGEQLTASIGMAVGTMKHAAEWSELYRQADGALYAAKIGGRDRAAQFSRRTNAAKDQQLPGMILGKAERTLLRPDFAARPERVQSGR